MSSTHRYTGLTPGALADGRPVAPGQDVTVTALKDGNLAQDDQLMVDAGVLQPLPDKTTKGASK